MLVHFDKTFFQSSLLEISPISVALCRADVTGHARSVIFSESSTYILHLTYSSQVPVCKSGTWFIVCFRGVCCSSLILL